jgi:hypothetical protein
LVFDRENDESQATNLALIEDTRGQTYMKSSKIPAEDKNTTDKTQLRDEQGRNGQLAEPGTKGPEHVEPGALDFNPADLEQPTEQTPPAGPDPFDAAALRLPSDFNAAVGVRKVLLSVQVRKPDKAAFVRVHPDEAYRLQTCVVELKEERESYLVARHLWPDLAMEATFRPKLLVTAITRQGTVFLWELNLPRADGRVDEWTRTALEAVNRAVTRWVRVTANMGLGAYDVCEATGALGEPEWPAISFNELLKLAFRDRFINDPNHPVLRRLRGEV